MFNHDYKAAVSDVLHKLDSAQLENRGFTKTIINKTVASGGKTPVYSTVLQFYKTIPCRRLLFVEEEIRRLWPEAWGPEVSKRVVSAVSRTMFFGGKICTAGIEVHLPPRGGCAERKEKRDSKPKCEDWCLFCFGATTEDWSYSIRLNYCILKFENCKFSFPTIRTDCNHRTKIF